MSAIQTRRSIEVTLATYNKVALYCELHNVAMSSFLESILKPALGISGMPSKRKPEQPPTKAPWRSAGLSYTRWDIGKKGRAVEVRP